MGGENESNGAKLRRWHHSVLDRGRNFEILFVTIRPDIEVVDNTDI